jgi:hypothetical protein
MTSPTFSWPISDANVGKADDSEPPSSSSSSGNEPDHDVLAVKADSGERPVPTAETGAQRPPVPAHRHRYTRRVVNGTWPRNIACAVIGCPARAGRKPR